jgi:pimeloyl-ACP methyl ester carboxylesterase
MPMARVADANIEYYLEGSGPPLLLISGFTAQASGWNEPFVRLLHSHFQLIRYSHRGTGTRSPDRRYQLTRPSRRRGGSSERAQH